LALANQITLRLDEGTSTAVIEGRTTPRPANVDDAVTGSLLFTLVMSDPAFLGATDAAPGAVVAADTITNDPTADDTGTLLYCRVSSTNDGITPLDDHVEGEAGTSGSDFNFNTLAVVAGAVISMSSFDMTMPEG
jgi:hypothetical protein